MLWWCKWILIKDKFEDEDSQWPDIDLFAICSTNSLRSHILKCSYKSRCKSFVFNKHFRKAIVCEFDMSIISNENIFRFKLPINNTITMQNLNPIDNFSNKISNDLLIELNFFFFEVEINVALIEIFHDYVNLIFVLECFSNCYEYTVVTYLLNCSTL